MQDTIFDKINFFHPDISNIFLKSNQPLFGGYHGPQPRQLLQTARRYDLRGAVPAQLRRARRPGDGADGPSSGQAAKRRGHRLPRVRFHRP